MHTKSTAAQNLAPGIKIMTPWRVAQVTAHDHFRLEVTFIDGLHGYVNLAQKIKSPQAGVFSKLQDPMVFSQVFLAHGVVTWPGELDLAPDMMYKQIQQFGEWIL